MWITDKEIRQYFSHPLESAYHSRKFPPNKLLDIHPHWSLKQGILVLYQPYLNIIQIVLPLTKIELNRYATFYTRTQDQISSSIE